VTPRQNSGNSLLGNSIFENGRANPSSLLGIDLTNSFVYPKDDGFTANDSKGHGAANDPNNFLDSPSLSSVLPVAGGLQITGTFAEAGESNTTVRLEFFASNPDPLGGVAEGQTFLSATNVTTNASGVASFSVTLPVNVPAGQLITATATNLTADLLAQSGADNLFNTSEFSRALQVPLTGNPPVNVSANVQVTLGLVSPVRHGRHKVPNRFQVQVTLKNTGGIVIVGPLELVLDHLPKKVKLVSPPAAGVTQANPPTGSPFVTLNVSALSPGATTALTLTFKAAKAKAVTFGTRVFAGMGTI
jgi:hypothetical protein